MSHNFHVLQVTLVSFSKWLYTFFQGIRDTYQQNDQNNSVKISNIIIKFIQINKNYILEMLLLVLRNQ